MIIDSHLILSQLRLPLTLPCSLSAPHPSRGISIHPGAYGRSQTATANCLPRIITNRISLKPAPLCQLPIIPLHSSVPPPTHLSWTPAMVPKQFPAVTPALLILFPIWQPEGSFKANLTSFPDILSSCLYRSPERPGP